MIWAKQLATEYQPPATVTFRQILVPSGPGQDAAKAEAIGRTVIEELAGGRDWCELNGVYGQSGSACTDFENIPLTDLLPELRESAAGLPLGSTSRPIRSSQGVHVLRVSKRVGAEPVAFEVVRDAVLNDLRSTVFDRELARVLDDLRTSAVIEINERYKSAEGAAAGVAAGLAAREPGDTAVSRPSVAAEPATPAVPAKTTKQLEQEAKERKKREQQERTAQGKGSKQGAGS